MADVVVKLLLVAGDAALASSLRGLLLVAGEARFEVAQATTLAEALAQLERHRFAVVLSELTLPDSAGLPTLARLLPPAHAAPIVLLVPPDQAALARSAIAEGAADYLITSELDARWLERLVTNAVARRAHAAGRPGAQPPLERQVAALTEELARTSAALERARGERRRVESEAQHVNRLKDDFLATVSHELRTPLTPILGWAQLLRTGQIDLPRATRALETIEQNAKLLARIVDDLLDVSRIISGKMSLEIRPVDLAPILERAAEAVRLAAEAKEIDLQLRIDRAAWPVAGDPNRLQQVFWNLLSNSIKFTPQGGRVRARLLRAGGSVRVAIEDSGCGIPPDFLPHVFDRFRQADGGATRAFGGLGLGLAIVRHLIEAHGGLVSAHSAGEGQGATFTIELPPASVRMLSRPPEPAPRPDVFPLQGVRVLVVDDDLDTCQLLVAVLAERGADVHMADSPSAAMQAILGWQPEVLLLDLVMPGGDGCDLLKRLRAHDAIARKIPAAALTAQSTTAARDRSLAAGFQVHVTKPVEPSQIIAVVADLARQARS